MPTNSQGPALTLPIGKRDHIQGPETAPCSLVEYGDYQCPHCAHALPMVKEVQNKMGKQLKFVFRHFPIASLHEHAQTAAEAAECAGVQGKFWEMHDMLFQNYKTLDDDHLMHFAGHLELDIEKFEQDMENHIGKEHVHEDFTSGVRSGVNGTPTFFINGVRYDGDYDADSIVKALKEAIKAK